MTVLNQTESFEPDDVGVQLAYLLGAIAMNSCVELTRGEPIHNILDRRFHRKHLIWAFITFDDT
jgi:hypothetical protein